jgi:hypothetical protein
LRMNENTRVRASISVFKENSMFKQKLIVALIFTALSSSVFAQATAVNPAAPGKPAASPAIAPAVTPGAAAAAPAAASVPLKGKKGKRTGKHL